MRELRAGALSLLLDGPDLRRLCWNGSELVRRIGFVVRDAHWGTVPALVDSHVVDATPGRFEAKVVARTAADAVDVSWEATVVGSEDGSLDVAVTWQARRDFFFNRIGLVVLHPPATCAGREYRARTGGDVVHGRFPERIAPQPYAGTKPLPLASFQDLDLDLDAGELSFSFVGERFEIEDQRNWADASFKTYSVAPAEIPHPARPGASATHSVRVVLPRAPSVSEAPPRRPFALAVGEQTGEIVGALGTELALEEPPLAADELEALRRLAPSHLQVRLCATDGGWRDVLERGLRTARAVGCPVELAVRTDPRRPEAVGPVIAAIAGRAVVRVLLFASDARPEDVEASTPSALIAAARDADVAVDLIGGTDLWFAELNRRPPALDRLDGVTYAISPLVHADDDATLIENLQALGATVRDARALTCGMPVTIGRLTLRPAQPDPRLRTALGGAWTLAALTELFGAGAATVTIHRSHGAGGMLRGGEASATVDVLRTVGELRGAHLLEVDGADLATTAALAVERAGRRILLLANLTPRPLELRITGAARIVLAPHGQRRVELDTIGVACSA